LACDVGQNKKKEEWVSMLADQIDQKMGQKHTHSKQNYGLMGEGDLELVFYIPIPHSHPGYYISIAELEESEAKQPSLSSVHLHRVKGKTGFSFFLPW